MVLFFFFIFYKVFLCIFFFDLFFVIFYVNWFVFWNKEVNWLGFFFIIKKKNVENYFGLKDIILSMFEVN